MESNQTCRVEIPDLQPETDSKENNLDAWEQLNSKLNNDSEIWSFFKKVIYTELIDKYLSCFTQGQSYPTLDIKFQKVVNFFAKKYLSGQNRNEFLASVKFFKDHPAINEQILDYAVTLAMGFHEDFSNDVLNPLEVNEELFFSTKDNQEDNELAGNDYSLHIK